MMVLIETSVQKMIWSQVSGNILRREHILLYLNFACDIDDFYLFFTIIFGRFCIDHCVRILKGTHMEIGWGWGVETERERG